MTIKSLAEQVQKRFNNLLKQHLYKLENHAPELKEAMEYALLMGGKRMRPLLAYSTGEMLGATQQDLDAIAVAVECIHAYSLVHDDLPAMDDDDLRRGHPTCHIAFDEATAILAGDALQTMAFEILATAPMSDFADTRRVELIATLAKASGYHGMCGGQAMDLSATNKQISQAHLEQLHSKKTGALLKASVLMAVTVSQKIDQSVLTNLEQYADNIGLAFQVQDDILDIVSDSETLGKPQGSDQAQNKSTYPALLGLQGAKDYLNDLHKQALQALDALPYNTQVLQLLADYTVERQY